MWSIADFTERKKLNKYIDLRKRISGEPKSLNYLLERFSIVIQSGNAINIFSTLRDKKQMFLLYLN